MNLLNLVFGRVEHTRRAEEPVVVEVDYPEGSYRAVVTMHRDTWRRPRWPIPRVRHRGTFECERGIPYPQPRKSVSDAGEDTLFATEAPGKTVREVVHQVITYVADQRIKYGGPDWRPNPLLSRRTFSEATMGPQQRRAARRLADGRRTYLPIVVGDGRYEVHADRKVYERTSGGGDRAKHVRLRRVDNPQIIRECLRAAAELSQKEA